MSRSSNSFGASNTLVRSLASTTSHHSLTIPEPHLASLHPLLPLFSLMLVRAQSASVSLRISIFYTRAIRSEDELKRYQTLPLGLTLSPGRPRLSALLDGVVERTSSKTPNGQKPSGVLVGVCGPVALGEEAGKTVRAFPRDKFMAVGGIELHEEYVVAYLASLSEPDFNIMNRSFGW